MAASNSKAHGIQKMLINV